jgi:hypothetical protein
MDDSISRLNKTHPHPKPYVYCLKLFPRRDDFIRHITNRVDGYLGLNMDRVPVQLLGNEKQSGNIEPGDLKWQTL